EDRSREKVRDPHIASGAIRVLHNPLEFVPRQPASDLSVSREKQHVAGVNELEGERETGVVGIILKKERELFGDLEPCLINPPPLLIPACFRVRAEVAAFERLPA